MATLDGVAEFMVLMCVITSNVSLNLKVKVDTVDTDTTLVFRTVSTLTLHHSPEMLGDSFSGCFSHTWRCFSPGEGEWVGR